MERRCMPQVWGIHDERKGVERCENISRASRAEIGLPTSGRNIAERKRCQGRAQASPRNLLVCMRIQLELNRNNRNKKNTVNHQIVMN